MRALACSSEEYHCLAGWSRCAAGGGERQSHTLPGWKAKRLRSSHRGPCSSGTPPVGESSTLLLRNLQHMDVKQGKCRHGAIVLLDTRSVIILSWKSKLEPSHTALTALLISLSCSFFCLWKSPARCYSNFLDWLLHGN